MRFLPIREDIGILITYYKSIHYVLSKFIGYIHVSYQHIRTYIHEVQINLKFTRMAVVVAVLYQPLSHCFPNSIV